MMLDLALRLAQRGIEYRWVGASAQNYGYPSGALHQCQPKAVVWHITASAPSPGPNPLAGLDSWFNNPVARACAHLGISGKHVHQYAAWDTAPYHAGWMANVDLTNPLITDWWARSQNPNFFTLGVEVVAEPSPARVLPGTHLVSADTWTTMLAVEEEVYRQLGIPRTLEHYIGHGQIDGVNRTRDPFNVYLPADIFAAQQKKKKEEDMAFAVKLADQRTWLIGLGTPLPVDNAAALTGLRSKGIVAPGPSIIVTKDEARQLGIMV